MNLKRNCTCNDPNCVFVWTDVQGLGHVTMLNIPKLNAPRDVKFSSSSTSILVISVHILLVAL